MAGSRIGALKTAARRAGVSPEDYAMALARGRKWCTGCRAFHPREAFGPDRSRSDGLAATCAAARDRRRARPSVTMLIGKALGVEGRSRP